MTVEELVLEYNNILFKNCMVILCNEQDAQDAVQDTFCRYIERTPDFKDKEHEKAWLMRVATNRCIDMHRFRVRHPVVDMEENTASCEMPEQSEVLLALTRLPAKLKTVIYLHYVEGYKTSEIAEMLGISTVAVKKRLQRGRELLKRTMTVAAVLLALGLISIPVKGVVSSLVRERLEKMSPDETTAIAEDAEKAAADDFTRDYTEEEKNRMQVLYEQYQEGVFPTDELPRADTEEEAEKLGFCFLVPDSIFYLPDRELTDEELLEIIDFYAKRDYAVVENYQETYAGEIAEKKADQKSLMSEVVESGGITEQEAIETASLWLETVFDITGESLEMNHYFDEKVEIGGRKGFYQVNWTDFPNRQYYYFYIDARDGSLAEIDYSSSVLVRYLDEFSMTEEEMRSRLPELEEKAVAFMKEQDNEASYKGAETLEKRVGFVFAQKDGTTYEVCYTWEGMFVMLRKVENED